MPILAREPDLYPEDLLADAADLAGSATSERWSAVYTMARREKDLMRRLRLLELAFYCPLVAKRTRSPAGRVRLSHVPLFPGYVFVFGRSTDRTTVFATRCVSRWLDVPDEAGLAGQLAGIHRLLGAGLAVVPEPRFVPGERVRVRSGPLAGLEGVIVRAAPTNRLVVCVDFLQRGASVQIDDWQVEKIEG